MTDETPEERGALAIVGPLPALRGAEDPAAIAAGVRRDWPGAFEAWPVGYWRQALTLTAPAGATERRAGVVAIHHATLSASGALQGPRAVA